MLTGNAAYLLDGASITVLVFAILAGWIAGRLGRRRTTNLGLAIFGVLPALNFRWWVMKR